MKLLERPMRLFSAAALLFLLACNNMTTEDTTAIKAYPNPYNPTQGNLTIEKTDGTAFTTPAQYDLVIYDFGLTEVYRANTQPVDGPTNKKIVWGGIDNSGAKVSPGNYYLRLTSIGAAGVANAESMFKLIVQ